MWKIHVRGILLHPSETKVWLLVHPEGYRLPGFTFCQAECGSLYQQYEGAFIPGLQDLYGCDLYLLETVEQWEDSESQRAETICVLEIREGHPTQGEWADMQTMSSRSFIVHRDGELVKQTLCELKEEAATPIGWPWQRRGWFREASQWVERELLRLGYGPVTNVEQGRATSDSAILRAYTGQAVFYFKAVAERRWRANEPAIAIALASYYPHVPKPVCIDAARRWMVTPEFGPTLDYPERDKELLSQAVYAHGQMQLDSATHTKDFLEECPLGVDLNSFHSKVRALLEEKANMLEPSEVDALYGHLPLLKGYIRQLADSPIPETIVHGDFAPHNIAQSNGKPLIFDWTRACISFPFFDMIEFLYRIRGESTAIRRHLKKAYLSAWTERAPLYELDRLWTVAEPLGHLFVGLHSPSADILRCALRCIEGA